MAVGDVSVLLPAGLNTGLIDLSFTGARASANDKWLMVSVGNERQILGVNIEES